jgi:ATP-dependent RNA helicase DeaD
MQNFNELKLPLPLEKALQAMKFEKPTPIQEQAIPAALTHRDLIGCAQTGTGKTLAFCVPTLARLIKLPSKTALVLVPTRELATQITDVLKQLTLFTPDIKSTILIGGMPMQPQIRSIQRRPRVIVATPGRLVDHLKRGTISLTSTEILILDEADRMLDMGFAPQLNQILRFLPKTRQTLFFSATLPADIEKLSMRFLKDPVRVTIGAISQPVKKIHQSVVQTSVAKKNDALLDQLNTREGSVLIFARTQVRTDRVSRYLEEYGVSVTRLHGGRSQGQRNSAVSGFRDGRFRVLVATDIAARGIDISHIAHIINYDLPMQAEDYVHRIGRTARAGADGQAVSLITPEDRLQWRKISRLYGVVEDVSGDTFTGEPTAAPKTKPAPRRNGAPNGASRNPRSSSGPRRGQSSHHSTTGPSKSNSPSVQANSDSGSAPMGVILR